MSHMDTALTRRGAMDNDPTQPTQLYTAADSCVIDYLRNDETKASKLCKVKNKRSNTIFPDIAVLRNPVWKHCFSCAGKITARNLAWKLRTYNVHFKLEYAVLQALRSFNPEPFPTLPFTLPTKPKRYGRKIRLEGEAPPRVKVRRESQSAVLHFYDEQTPLRAEGSPVPIIPPIEGFEWLKRSSFGENSLYDNSGDINEISQKYEREFCDDPSGRRARKFLRNERTKVNKNLTARQKKECRPGGPGPNEEEQSLHQIVMNFGLMKKLAPRRLESGDPYLSNLVQYAKQRIRLERNKEHFNRLLNRKKRAAIKNAAWYKEQIKDRCLHRFYEEIFDQVKSIRGDLLGPEHCLSSMPVHMHNEKFQDAAYAPLGTHSNLWAHRIQTGSAVRRARSNFSHDPTGCNSSLRMVVNASDEFKETYVKPSESKSALSIESMVSNFIPGVENGRKESDEKEEETFEDKDEDEDNDDDDEEEEDGENDDDDDDDDDEGRGHDFIFPLEDEEEDDGYEGREHDFIFPPEDEEEEDDDEDEEEGKEHDFIFPPEDGDEEKGGEDLPCRPAKKQRLH